jgi:hypothetical protein
MDVTRVGLGVSPLPEFLRQPTVVRFGALPICQTLLHHEATHTGLARLQINVSSGKEFLQGQAVLRGVRMEREMCPHNLDVILFLQPLNTPGTEIAPGSDIVREDFYG